MEDLTDRLVEFVGALRSKGVPAGTSETVDAAAVAAALGLDHRHRLREGLASALVRRGGQRDVFDMTFDLYFPAGLGASTAELDHGDADRGDLRDLLTTALAENDLRRLQDLANLAVGMLGEVAAGGSSDGGWSAHQTMDRLSPRTLVAAAERMRERAGTPDGGSGDVSNRLDRDEVRRAVDAFRAMVETEARRRTAELRGRDVVTRHAVRQGTGQVEFLTANAQQLAELRRAVQPLSRKLATRLAARRRRSRRGRIEIRRTLRRSMGTGGIPMRPVHAPPRPARPELVLLCDMSGSVAGFSDFTMLLVRALKDQFSKVRVFAFVNTVDEVTDLVRAGGGDLRQNISQNARITKWHSSSDYGESLVDFVSDHVDAVGPRTAVLILGDARNNNQAVQVDALRVIAQRSRRTYWLNPEHTSRWGVGDSVALDYAEVVSMHECCTMDQLERFISRLLPI